MIICPQCNKEFDDPKKYGGHYSSHFRSEKYKLGRKKQKILSEHSFYLTGKHKCKHCNQEFETGQGLGAHIISCLQNPNHHRDHFSILGKRFEKVVNPEKSCFHCGSKGDVLWVGKYCRKCKLDDYPSYVMDCKFRFDVYRFPLHFDISLIEKHGWYSPPNRGNNTSGVSRDHMLSINEGFMNNIDPKILSHPANCKLMKQSDNSRKHRKSSITIEELKQRITEFENTYGEYK